MFMFLDNSPSTIPEIDVKMTLLEITKRSNIFLFASYFDVDERCHQWREKREEDRTRDEGLGRDNG